MNEEIRAAVEAAEAEVSREARWIRWALEIGKQKAKLKPGEHVVRIPCLSPDLRSEDPSARTEGIRDQYLSVLRARGTSVRAVEEIEAKAMAKLRAEKNDGAPRWLPLYALGWEPYKAGYRVKWPGGGFEIQALSESGGITVDGWRQPKSRSGPDVTDARADDSGSVGTVMITDVGIGRLDPNLPIQFHHGSGVPAEDALPEEHEDLLLLWAENKFGVAPLLLRITITPKDE